MLAGEGQVSLRRSEARKHPPLALRRCAAAAGLLNRGMDAPFSLGRGKTARLLNRV